MENIGNYVEACSAVGVPAQDLFMTVDLYEGKNLAAVVRNIHSLGRVAQSLGFNGPQLGARLSTRNERKFSDAQLALAKAMPARWTNRGNTIDGEGSSRGGSMAASPRGSKVVSPRNSRPESALSGPSADSSLRASADMGGSLAVSPDRRRAVSPLAEGV